MEDSTPSLSGGGTHPGRSSSQDGPAGGFAEFWRKVPRVDNSRDQH